MHTLGGGGVLQDVAATEENEFPPKVSNFPEGKVYLRGPAKEVCIRHLTVLVRFVIKFLQDFGHRFQTIRVTDPENQEFGLKTIEKCDCILRCWQR